MIACPLGGSQNKGIRLIGSSVENYFNRKVLLRDKMRLSLGVKEKLACQATHVVAKQVGFSVIDSQSSR